MFDDDWEDFRAEAHAFIKEKEETILKNWLDKIGYKDKDHIGYYRNTSDHTMEIYSCRVGALIGRAGANVELLKKMLADEFRGEWKVKFIEIRGGFTRIQNDNSPKSNYMEYYLLDVKRTVKVNGKDIAFDYINTYYYPDEAVKEAKFLSTYEDVKHVSVHKWYVDENGVHNHSDDIGNILYCYEKKY